MEIHQVRELLREEPPTRTTSIDRGTMRADERAVPLAFSSEEPVVRWWGIEILDHSRKAMRTTRTEGNGLPLLFNHDRDVLLGRLRDIAVGEDRKGRGTANFDDFGVADEKFRQVQAGSLTDVSVGFQVHYVKEVKTEDLSEDLLKLSAREKLPVYLINDWEPFEASLVTVAADPTVGVGRTVAREKEDDKALTGKHPEITPTREDKHMTEPIVKDPGELAQIEADMKKARDAASKDAEARERTRCEDIHKYWYKFRDVVPEYVRDKAIREGMSIEQFRGIVLDKIDDSGGSRPLDTPLGQIGLTPGEVQRYSILRAIRAAANKDWRGAEFEKQCSDQVAKQTGMEPRSFFLPYDIMAAARDPRELRGVRERALNVASDPAGGYLVGTAHMPGSFIELLRARLVAARAGVQIMSGLVGNVDIPKQTGASTAYWLSTETTDVTESAPTFGQVLLSPKSVGAYVDITRRLAIQSTPAADNLVMNDIVRVLGLGIDRAVFHGTGEDGQPSGIGKVAAGEFTGAAFSWILAISAVTDVMDANADVPGMNWVTNPVGWGVLKTREKGTAGYPTYLCGDDDRMAGFPVLHSTQITAANLFFGDFAQAILGEWGVLDLNVDTASLSKSGGIRIVGFQSVDVAVRQAGAFTLADDLS
jgi:HK97 family phage major capsid protein